jgi:PPP family 3-phenylpropionic acid transporter
VSLQPRNHGIVRADPSETQSPGARAARVTLVMACLFATAGVVLVFLPRWLEVERGLSGAEIGAVLSLAQAARILTGPAIAYWADGVPDRRTPLRLISIAALVAYAAFFFLAQGFWALLALGFAALSLTQALTPLVEAATLRATAVGKLPYGVARGLGSIAFIVANVAGGVLIARFGLGAVVAWVLVGLATVVASSWLGLSPDPAPREPHGGARRGAAADLLRNRRFLILIVACGLIQSAHGFYYGFSTLVWRGQGISPETVGLLWAFGVAVEVVFLMSLNPIERRISPEALILIGAGGGAVRWLLMGFAPVGAVLWPLQALHALSFAAAHVGAMRLLYRDAPDAAAGMAQTLYAALSGGLLMGASTLLSGVLYDAAGARGYWAMAATTIAGGALALLLLQRANRVTTR